MKKILCLFLAILLLSSLFVACDIGEGVITESPSETVTENNTVSPTEEPTAEATVSAFGTESTPPTDEPTSAPTDEPTTAPTEEPTTAPTEEPTSAPTEEPTQAPTEEPTQAPTEEPTSAPTEEPTPAPTEEPTVAPTEEPTVAPTEEPTSAPPEEPTESEAETDAPKEHKYKSFTAEDVKLIRDTVGTLIPFIPTDEYKLSIMTLPDDKTLGIDFTTYGNTKEEVFEYLKKFSSWTRTYTDLDNDFGYSFVEYRKNNLIAELHFATDVEKYLLVLVYPDITDTNTPTEEPTQSPTEEPTSAPTEEPTVAPTEKPTEPPTPPASSHIYTDFKSDEKAMFTDTFGFVIPFIPNDEYYVDDLADYGFTGLNFYTFGNTSAEFDAYRALFSDYTYDGTETDYDGYTWYFYYKDTAYVEMCYYLYEGYYVTDVYVYLMDEVEDPTTDPETPTEEPTDAPATDNGTLESPLSVTQAYNANKGLAEGSASSALYYVEGTVKSIGNTGSYYQNVYITDGTTDLLIYTINMGDGISGFRVGDTIVAYGYFKNYKGTIEMATNNSVYVYAVKVEAGEGGDTPPASSHTYTDFESDEKAMFTDTFGFVIPFIPNDEYYVEEYELEGESGINFYTFGNTSAEYDAYRALFSSYTDDGTYEDYYGDTWYCYSEGDVYVDMCYYLYDDNTYVVDVYVFVETEGGSGESGGESGGSTTPSDLITNDGAGLPEDDGDGIYDVDFTKGQYVQSVTDQGYYIDGCPTTGAPAVLVIPVDFSDVPADEGYTTDNIEKIFNGTGNDTAYHSVHEYFFMSSYEALNLQITVLDEWFRPANTSTYYANETYDYYGSEIAIGDQLVLDEALAYLEGIIDLSAFDSDGNSVIDAVVMVTTLEINSDVDFYWAYRYWNVYTDDEGNYFEYDGVSANDYAWIPYDFMFEEYNEETKEINYDKSNPLNPYTFIHEFGHVLGADDYYDTSYTEHPLGGADMMDAMQGDHNPYTKFNYGWLTTSRLITTKSEVTVTLDAFVNSGDTVIIANNWDENLGAYQEYFVVAYYTNTGLNSNGGGYFSRDGIVVYHVNASLYAEVYGEETYYDVYFNNTDPSDQYGTEENLIEFVKHADGEKMIYTYIEGDSLPSVSDDAGNALGYTFTVDSLTETTATLTFKALN